MVGQPLETTQFFSSIHRMTHTATSKIIPAMPASRLVAPRATAPDPARLPQEGNANPLTMPDSDSANIAHNLLEVAAGNTVAVGPLLLGAAMRD